MIPNTVEEIGNHAFWGCDNLTLFFEDSQHIDQFESRWNNVDSDNGEVNIKLVQKDYMPVY